VADAEIGEQMDRIIGASNGSRDEDGRRVGNPVTAARAGPDMISVVVPVRDAMPWLEVQLQALVDQQGVDEFEIVVVDNGSVDESVEVAQRWAERHRTVRWIDGSEVVGPGAARNVGVGAARGRLLAFCDADDVVRPGWLTACAAGLTQADVVAGVFDFWSLNGYPASPLRPAATRQLGFLPAGLGANLAVRRQPFDAVGGFAEDLRVGEDIDLCWRLQLGGSRFEIVPDAVVSKRDHPGFARSFRHGTTYGLSGPALYRRHRSGGAQPDLAGAAKSWLWLATHAPSLVRRDGRDQWAHAAGMRTGRLRGSIRERVLFP
jgi:glycosyltransferase involved in cell wall biosynthesis